MSCIGTAGHVDHGKSTLVKALTGIDPDRLAEEKERGMTIDLGFAWLTLPSGREVSIVDVPGHESFIKNMLAGVGGIDAALLVIAADEGIMPQTDEHLAILDLLHVSRGVVALTKCDLIEPDWREMVREEVAEKLAPTTLKAAAIIPVSSYTREGIPALLKQLDTLLDDSAGRGDNGRPRLPIDRVFTITGFGTVVTGTLLDGRFKNGQEVELLPQRIRARIRSLQSHKHTVEEAQPGGRVAINLSGVSKSDLARGNVVSLPGLYEPATLLDAQFTLLDSAPRPLAHNAVLDFYTGAQQIVAKVRVLEGEEVAPGATAWVQIVLEEPGVVARHDRFILRQPSPSITIGGGEIIDLHPRAHRRNQPRVLQGLELLKRGTPEELFLQALSAKVAMEAPELFRTQNLPKSESEAAIAALVKQGDVLELGAFYMTRTNWSRLTEDVQKLLGAYHRQYPLRSGMPREELRSRLSLPPKLANELFSALSRAELLHEERASVALLEHRIHLDPVQQAKVDAVLTTFRRDPYSPPSRNEVEAQLSGELLAMLLEQGRLLRVSESVLFLAETYQEMVGLIVSHIRRQGKITVAEARDLLKTSRKYMLALLEYLDEQKITRRSGDDRILGPLAPV